MKKLKRWIFLILIPLIILAVTAFMLENQRVVTVSFLGWSSGEISVASCLISALLAGMAIGPIFTLVLKGQRDLKASRGNRSAH